jgi:hypothetical protein
VSIWRCHTQGGGGGLDVTRGGGGPLFGGLNHDEFKQVLVRALHVSTFCARSIDKPALTADIVCAAEPSCAAVAVLALMNLSWCASQSTCLLR